MSTNGSRIAISGSESNDSDEFRGVVKIFDGNSLLYTIPTDYLDAVAPIVSVVLSGDGKTLAVGSVFPAGGIVSSGVKLFDLTNEAAQQIGFMIEAGTMGASHMGK